MRVLSNTTVAPSRVDNGRPARLRCRGQIKREVPPPPRNASGLGAVQVGEMYRATADLNRVAVAVMGELTSKMSFGRR